MTSKEFEVNVKKLYSLLDLKYKSVGVKIIETKEEYDTYSALEVKNSINYCGAVRAASKGNSIKICKGKFKCKSAERIFGIDDNDPLNSSGENWFKLGLYKEMETAKKIRLSQSSLKNNYGVLVMPLENFKEMPDVALIFDNPYVMMRLTQAYSYTYGPSIHKRAMGNQAVCYESTMIPLESDEINFSLLCIGTRHRANWSVNDMSVGIPRSKFKDIILGLEKTMNLMENNENKKRILKKYEENNLGEIKCELGYNYYKSC
ncbi:MAG: DUF169 domain-containing protein [Peptostreptococcus sp.]|uniref:DUF169 domain-containing protein n=1 Tax=Peptostreptococcus sp. TaxID=1262 RepID=UPI002FCC8E50